MPVDITTETYTQIKEMMMILTQGRDLPKFQEEVFSLVNTVADNVTNPAAPTAVPANFTSLKSVTFVADPHWGVGSKFTIAGSTSNDGTYIISGYEETTPGVVEYFIYESFVAVEAGAGTATVSGIETLTDDAADYVMLDLYPQFREGDDSVYNKNKIYAIHDSLSSL